MSLDLQYLPKKGGSRFKDVSTYKLLCDDPENFKGIKSLKSAEEVGSGPNEFTHVLLSKIRDTKEKCIIKIHRSENPFLSKEIGIMSQLSDYKNIVQFVCTFNCKGNKDMFMKPIEKPMKYLCAANGNVDLTFIVMEYIANGDVEQVLSITNKAKLRSLILQTALIIIELGTIYHVFHGDLNSGNILVKPTHKKTLTYTVYGKEHVVETMGIRPVLIDFGRGGYYDQRSKNKRNIIEDILTMILVFSSYIVIPDLKDSMRELANKYVRSTNIDNLILDIYKMF